MTDRVSDNFDKCSDAVHAALSEVMTRFDGRVVFSCVAGELAGIGAALRAAGVQSVESMVFVLSEVMTAVVHKDVPKPKVAYHLDGEPMGSKQ